MSREIKTHVVHEGDRQPQVSAMGSLGAGGAEQFYRISYSLPGGRGRVSVPVNFVSLEDEGVTNEALLAIVIDRLEAFQAGKFSCRENAVALAHCLEALSALQVRTKDRMDRGVENKMEK